MGHPTSGNLCVTFGSNISKGVQACAKKMGKGTSKMFWPTILNHNEAWHTKLGIDPPPFRKLHAERQLNPIDSKQIDRRANHLPKYLVDCSVNLADRKFSHFLDARLWQVYFFHVKELIKPAFNSNTAKLVIFQKEEENAADMFCSMGDIKLF